MGCSVVSSILLLNQRGFKAWAQLPGLFFVLRNINNLNCHCIVRAGIKCWQHATLY